MDHKEAMLLMLHTMTPTHAGSGTQLSYVDLPIQRESHTGFPKIEASTLKGCIRCAVSIGNEEDQKQKAAINGIFGNPGNGDFASAVSFTDARLLFFPVKSAIGIFAWITCPYVIRRFLQDYCVAGGKAVQLDFPADAFTTQDGTAYYPSAQNCALKASSKGLQDQIMLEDYTYQVQGHEAFSKFLEQVKNHIPDCNIGDKVFLEHTILVSDDDFCQFVKYSTEVSTRIKIDQKTGTVDGTALFTEEFLPPESILYSIVICHGGYQSQQDNGTEIPLTAAQVKETLRKMLAMDVFQIGADSTLGKGLVKKCFWEVSTDGSKGA